MDDSRRATGTGFAADFDEFDLLLEDDEDDAPRSAPPRPGRGAVDAAAVRETGGVRARTRPRPRIRTTLDWNRVGAVALLAAIGIALAWFIVSTVADSRRSGAYQAYFDEVRDIASQSTAQGDEFSELLSSTDGGTATERIAAIEDLASRAEQVRARADEFDVPQRLTGAHDSLQMALAFRSDGLKAVQSSLAASIDTKDQAEAAQAVSASLMRLVASDVVWADSFAAESRAVLKSDGAEGVTVPDSVFAPDTDLYGPKAVEGMLDRFATSTAAGATDAAQVPADGKIRGGEVGQVMVSPSGQTLLPGQLTEVKGGEDIVFEVPFTNQGEVQLTNVPVDMTIRGSESDPITLTGVIELVEPGETATARIPLDQPPNFGETLDFDALVGPIPGEKTADNNRTSGQIRFSL